MTTGTWIATALAAAAMLLALLSFRRPAPGRHAMTMQLSLTLLRYDEGLGLLAAHTRRAHRWWEDVDPAEQHLIDRALSMWDLAAWYVATGRVERRAVLQVFGWNIVDLWERAYPYVLHRRVDQPTLWPSLTDLYLDAYDASVGVFPRHDDVADEPEPAQADHRSVSPVAVVQEHEATAEASAPVSVPVENVTTYEHQRRPELPRLGPLPLEPLPHRTVRSSDVGGAGSGRPRVPVSAAWAEALRAAGPVAASRAPAAPKPTAQPQPTVQQRLTQAMTEEWGSGTVSRPAAPPRPPTVASLDLGVEQSIDLTDATSTVRSQVLG